MTSAPNPSAASHSLQAGVDDAVVSSADQAFVAGLRARVEDDLASCGQGGGGQYLAWQTPGVLQILVDTERKYYQHSVDDMLSRANFNRPDRFDLSDGGQDVARATQAIAQLVWEERTCGGVADPDCMFDRDASGDTDLRRLLVVGVDRDDAVKPLANDEIPNDYASTTSGGSNPATRAAALVLKTTYLRMRTFVSAHQGALPFGVDDDFRYW